MFATPMVNDGLTIRRLQPGDILNVFDPIPPATDTTNTTLTYTAANLLNTPVYLRTPAGVSTDTFPTAAALIAALSAILGVTFVPTGLSFRWRVINLSANLLTGAVTANTGVTMTRGNVLASTTKDFQINITNGMPSRSVIATADGTTAVLTGLSATDLKNLSIGMVITNVVAGAQGFTIIGINLAAQTVTLSAVTSVAAALGTFTFSPTYTITGLAA